MLASLRNLLLGVSPGRSLRSFVGALAVLALLGAAGCGGGGGEAPPPPPPPPPPEEPAAPRQETTEDRTTGNGAEEYEYEEGESQELKFGCQLDQATVGMSPEERGAYRQEVVDEAYANNTSPEEVLAERDYTC